MNNVLAFIDGANLHKGVGALGWKLDYKKFRSWLRQKFGVTDAYIFLGLIAKQAELYTALQNAGYKLIFKDVVYDSDGKAKGNCDADLVLKAIRDYFENKPESVVLVASDGDYASLVKFWKEKEIDCSIISPAPIQKCSILLKRTGVPILYLNEVKNKLGYSSK